MRVGVEQRRAEARPRLERRRIGPAQARPSRRSRRTSEKPFECNAGRGEAEHDVAGREIAARQQLVALDRADGKAGEVVVAACR